MKKSNKRVSLFTVFIYFFLLYNISFLHAQKGNSDIDLQSAINMMRFAKSHSGYTFDKTQKCLFPYISAITDNWKSIPQLSRQDLSAMFLRPNNPQSWWYVAGLPKTYSTPHFKFHYTTEGPDAVISDDISPLNGIPDLIDICAESFEKSYRIEVEEMGYNKPISDIWAKDNGGDERYDVYFFSGPWLGFTMPEEFVSVQSTAITTSFYFGINSRTYELVGASEGRRYIETTCCHEFFHSIQFAYNYYSERWFMESTCTWMERIVYDGSDQGETDGNNYYTNQLNYWFRYPDWSLTIFDGWHEYGSVIWSIFLTERYDIDIIKDIFKGMAEGTYRELASFYDAFTSRGTTLSQAFKEFTVWNYFTNYRYDERFYSRGRDYPPIPIHLDDVIAKYPMKTDLDSERAPENLGARYIRFLPSSDQNSITIKVNGTDITDTDELQRLFTYGTRGWGAKLIVYQKNRSPRVEEMLLFPSSQEGQITFSNFGSQIEEIVLILSNLHPDLDIYGISYSSGQPPKGKLSEPRVISNDVGEVVISWDLIDISEIKEFAIVRKRFALSEGDLDDSDIREPEVYRAFDLDNDGIPDGNIDIVGKVSVAETSFIDKTVFQDVDPNRFGFDPKSVRYYYAVVPVNEYGIMGTPAIAKGGITPSSNNIIKGSGTISNTKENSLICYPNPFYINKHNYIKFRPIGYNISIYNINGELIKKLKDNESEWDGRNEQNQVVAGGVYFYIAENKGAIKKGKFVILW